MSFNATISVECKAAQVAKELAALELDDKPKSAIAKGALEDEIAAAATAAKRLGGTVLATVNVHVGEKDDDGFESAHVSTTVSRVSPAAFEQRKQQEAEAREAGARETDRLHDEALLEDVAFSTNTALGALGAQEVEFEHAGDAVE